VACPKEFAAQTTQPYEIVVTRDVILPARDGIRLATNVYVPGRGGATAGRFPTIVERTPYNKDTAADALTGYFVPRGYAVVMQDIRGRYKSEGRWRPIQDDGPDGADLLKWIASQPWSNGKVGTVGTSYNYGTHKTPSVVRWFARHPRYQLHFRDQRLLGESGGTMVRRNHQQAHSAWLIYQCAQPGEGHSGVPQLP
jgi:hypothetical protein